MKRVVCYQGIRIEGWIDGVRLDEEKLSTGDLREFRDFVVMAEKLKQPITGEIDISGNAYDEIVTAIGGLPRPLVDLTVISRKPQLVLRHRRDGWRSRLRFQPIVKTYEGATIEVAK